MIDASQLIYKDKEFKYVDDFIDFIEKKFEKELTPSLLHAYIPKKNYSLNVIRIINKLRCIKEFKFKKKNCKNMIEEFKYYDKKLLKESVEVFYSLVNNNCNKNPNGLIFYLFCKPMNYEIDGIEIFCAMETMMKNIEIIYNFINLKKFFNYFKYSFIYISFKNCFYVCKAIYFCIKKSKNNIDIFLQLKKKSYNFSFLANLCCEHYCKIKNTKYLSKMSDEYLKTYFFYSTNEIEFYRKNKWREKILKRIFEDELIFEMYMEYILKDNKRKKFLEIILQLVKNNVKLFSIFLNYRHHPKFLASEKNIKKMYLKMIDHKFKKFNFLDYKKIIKIGNDFFSICLKKYPPFLNLIYKNKNYIKQDKITQKIIRNISIFLYLIRKGGPLLEINLIKPILSYLD